MLIRDHESFLLVFAKKIQILSSNDTAGVRWQGVKAEVCHGSGQPLNYRWSSKMVSIGNRRMNLSEAFSHFLYPKGTTQTLTVNSAQVKPLLSMPFVYIIPESWKRGNKGIFIFVYLFRIRKLILGFIIRANCTSDWDFRCMCTICNKSFDVIWHSVFIPHQQVETRPWNNWIDLKTRSYTVWRYDPLRLKADRGRLMQSSFTVL